MTVAITDNLIEIDAVDASNEAGWLPTSSSDYAGFQRAGSLAYGDQAGEEVFNQFFTDSSVADYSSRTIFGWMRSGNPHVEASDGFGIILGDRLQEVATQAINAAGTGYAALDEVTVVGGTGTAATITVDTVGGGGEILTSSLNAAGAYSVLPATPNSVSGGSGSGATFDLTFQTGTVGTRTSYTVGGGDNYGNFGLGWSGFRLDCASLPTGFVDIVGTAPPNLTRILDIGYAIGYQTKAAGNSDNIFFDRLTFIANGSPALTIAGGTTGARGTFAQMVTEDLSTSNAYGIISEIVGAKAYTLYFGIDFGDSGTASSYFEDSNFQLFIDGNGSGDGGMTAGNMDIAMLANSTGTNVMNLSDFLIQGIGTIANLDFSDPDVDELKWQRGVITDIGTLLLPPQDVGNAFLSVITFNNCGQVTPNTLDLDDITFNGSSDATGALLLDENQDTEQNITNVDFVSDGTGHAIQLAPTGAGPFVYNFDNWSFTGYGSDDTNDAAVDINPSTSNADITINVLNNGDTPTTDQTGYSGILTVNNTVTVSVGGVTEGAAIKVIANETAGTITVGDVIFALLADSNGVSQITTFNYEGAFGAGLSVIIRARQQGLCNFAISEDNAAFVDETTESNSSTTSDMNLLVDTSPVAGQDWFYFGHAEQFSRMKLDITTAMAGGALLDFEYWNGAWVNLSGVVDGTSDYTNTGENTIAWTLPGDWATTTIDSLYGPSYFVRIGYLSGTVSTAPRGRKCKLDVTRYLPFVQNNEITSTGLSTVASWTVDAIAIF